MSKQNALRLPHLVSLCGKAQLYIPFQEEIRLPGFSYDSSSFSMV